MSDELAMIDTILMAAAILEPLVMAGIVLGLGRHFPVTGAAPMVVVLLWALFTGVGLYAWGGALGLVTPLKLVQEPFNALQLWLLGWICVSGSGILALGFWRAIRREDEDEDEAEKDLVTWR